jgi:hypothetical protein
MKMGNVIIRIFFFFFPLRLLCGYFMIRTMKYYLNVLAWPQNVLTILNEGIVHLLYSKCNPFMVDGGIVCNMA